MTSWVRTGGARGTIRLLVVLATCCGALAATRPGLGEAFTTTPFAIAMTGPASYVGAHGATLEGSVRPSGSVPAGSTARVYFELGPSVPYELRSVGQAVPANRPLHLHISLTGLQSDRLYHYRLVSVDNDYRTSVGADRTFRTTAEGRSRPGLLVSVEPAFQFTFPAVVRVSGSLVLPQGVSEKEACNGFVDITFRARTVAVQTLRAGVGRDCRFRLAVRFSERRRLKGGHLSVDVLFVGNRLLQRCAAPPSYVQLG
jgi:hypothetical protein